MGSGKSSVAVKLADALSIPVKDTDTEVEKSYKLSIPEIFKKHGEAVFRRYENEVLKKMPVTNTIIATGGGIIETEDNISWMQTHGIVIYLHTSFNEITNRLKNDTNRPLWQAEDKQQLFERRLDRYHHTATFTVTTDGKKPEDIAAEIIARL